MICKENSSITGLASSSRAISSIGGARCVVGRPVQLQLKALALAHSGHIPEAEAMRRAEHRLALRVVNLRL